MNWYGYRSVSRLSLALLQPKHTLAFEALEAGLGPTEDGSGRSAGGIVGVD